MQITGASLDAISRHLRLHSEHRYRCFQIMFFNSQLYRESFMSTLLLQIAKNQAQLEQHIFCQHLIHDKDTSVKAYSFVPHMTFFILGFRDILEEVRIKDPKTEMEASINAHVDEDADHWLLFIEDMKSLNMDVNYWGGDMSAILKMLWSRENYPVRELVYRIINHIRAAKTAEEKMIIIDCMESTFSVFINSLNVVTHRSGRYDTLKFFGREHFEAEANHTSGNWLEGGKDQEQAHYFNIQRFRVRHVSMMIDDIFQGFDQVFSCWYNSMKTVSATKMDVAV